MTARCLSLAAALIPIFMSFGNLAQTHAAAEPRNSMNSLFVIAPYKHQGTWVFDDPRVGLHQETFVLGINTMIDKEVGGVPNAENGFRAIFSAQEFPGAQTKLEWRRGETGGNWYYSDKFGMEGWLCPALFKYFPQAPGEIWVRVE